MAPKSKVAKKSSSLIAVASELNDVLGLDPAIDMSLGEDELKAEILDVVPELSAKDKLTDATREALVAMGATLPEAEVAEAKPAKADKKAKKAPVKVEEPEEEDEDVEDEGEEAEEEEEVKSAKNGKKDAKVVAKVAPKAEKAEKPVKAAKAPVAVAQKTTRSEAIAKVLGDMKEGHDFKEEALIASGNTQYQKEGGSDNVKETRFAWNYLKKALLTLGLLAEGKPGMLTKNF